MKLVLSGSISWFYLSGFIKLVLSASMKLVLSGSMVLSGSIKLVMSGSIKLILLGPIKLVISGYIKLVLSGCNKAGSMGQVLEGVSLGVCVRLLNEMGREAKLHSLTRTAV